MNITPKISVIVPVYNTEKYLHRCIDSILSQTFTDFELLLINDGSKDRSGAICDEYAAKDNRVRVFHKENGGVSSARNLGLDSAYGEYIIFLDSDDYWLNNMALELLYNTAIKFGLDIVRGEYKAVNKDGKDLFLSPLLNTRMKYSKRILSSDLFYTKIICGENFLVLSLIKSVVLEKLRFNPNRSFLEDMEFYAKMLMKPMRCMFLPLEFYAYRKISESASNTPNVKNLADSFSMCEVFESCCLNLPNGELKESYRYNSIMMYFWTLETLSNDVYYSERNTIIYELNLNQLQRKIANYAKNDTPLKYPLIIYLNPAIGVSLLRYYIKIKCFVSRCLRGGKSIFGC